MMTRRLMPLVTAIALALPGCGGEGGTEPPPPPPFGQLSFLIATQNYIGPGGCCTILLVEDSMPVPSDLEIPLPLRAVRLSAGSIDMSSGAVVTWAIESGGGSLASGSTPIQNGQLSNDWFLGPIRGVQSISLTAPETPEYLQHLRIRVVQAPVRVEREGPDALIGTAGTTLPDPLVIRVLDGNGAPIPRVAVVMPGNPIGEGFTDSIRFCLLLLNPACGGNFPRVYRHVGYTNADGVVASRFTFPMQAPRLSSTVAEPQIPVPLAVPLGSSQFVTALPGILWTVQTMPGPAAQLAIVSGEGQTGATGATLGLPLVVRLSDQYDNPIADEAVTWASSGGGSLAMAVTTTDGTGQTSNSWTLGPGAGTQTVSATVGSFTVTFTAVASGS